ncbi:MAG: hypothetical protein R3F55_22435 [Alphaproteobacteria bacterium]
MPVIGAPSLGHADVKTTSRYAHLADDPLKAAAGRIADAVASAMGEAPADTVEAEIVPIDGKRRRA